MLIKHDSISNKEFCGKILNILNSDERFKNKINYTPRIVGDIVQEVIEEKIESTGYIKTNTVITKRSMPDVEIYDDEKNILVIDIKTHLLKTGFHMPNLSSIKRLCQLYKDNNKYFMLLFVDYELLNNKPIFKKVWFLPIENISWSCLSIGALGYGQLQIKNADNIIFKFDISRGEWLNIFKNKVYEYIEKQRKKLDTLIKLFE